MHPVVAKVDAECGNDPGDSPVPGQGIDTVVVIDIQVARKHDAGDKGPEVKT